MSEAQPIENFPEVLARYMQRFDDSPPARVMYAGDPEEAIRLMTRAMARGRPLAEDGERGEDSVAI
jgi:hypothetical protein